MLVLGNYLTPNLMGGKNSLWFTEQIYNQFIASFNWNQGAAFGFLLLLLSSAIIWCGLKLSGQRLGEVAHDPQPAALARLQPGLHRLCRASISCSCSCRWLVTCMLAFNDFELSFPALARLHPRLVYRHRAGPGRHLPGQRQPAGDPGQFPDRPVGLPDVVVGVCAAFLFEQEEFYGKNFPSIS
jgi:hypothetical protein